jgi:hypothetical protein
MKSLKLLLGLGVVFALSACTFDKKNVDDAQDKEKSRQLQKDNEKLQVLRGGYSGYLTIENEKFELVMALTPIQAGDKPQISAEIKRSDVIFAKTAVLAGPYLSDGTLTLSKPASGGKNKAADTPPDPSEVWDLGELYGRADGQRIYGTLRTSTAEIGTFEVVKDGSVPTSLGAMDYCHPFYKALRKRAYEVSGFYQGPAVPAPNTAPPFEVNLDVHPSIALNQKLEASYTYTGGVENPVGLQGTYVSYLYKGSNSFGAVTLSGKDSKGNSYEINVRRTSRDDLEGDFYKSPGAPAQLKLHRQTAYSVNETCN